LTIYLLITYILTFLLQWKGVKSIGKAAYVTGLVPFITLGILLANGCSLDGSFTGIKYFLLPDLWKLLEPKV
jgi:SNF family Na+-dependent transporter